MKEFVYPSRFIWQKEGYRDNYGSLAIEPLERGFGVTLGNAMRRVLLSCVPGIAFTSVKISGASHEFSTLKGVKEDLVEVLLNLKQVALRPVVDEFPRKLKVQVSGASEILARDLGQDGSVEVLNGDLHIMTLDPDLTLNMELEVGKGFGYDPVEKVKQGRKETAAGTMFMDAIYTPVRKVTFHVESTRVGQSVDYEKLILQLWTTGAVTPADAVRHATGTLNRHFSLVNEGQQIGEKPVKKDPERAVPEGDLDIPITELRLSTRVCNVLSAQNVHTLGQLVGKSRDDFEGMKNLGKKSIEEIAEALRKKGYRLAPERGEDDET